MTSTFYLLTRQTSYRASGTSQSRTVPFLSWVQSSCWAPPAKRSTSWRPWSSKTSDSSSFKAGRSISWQGQLWFWGTLQVEIFWPETCFELFLFRYRNSHGKFWCKHKKPCHSGLICSWFKAFQLWPEILPRSFGPPQLHSDCQTRALFSPGGFFVPTQTSHVPLEGGGLPNRNQREGDFCESKCWGCQHLF